MHLDATDATSGVRRISGVLPAPPLVSHWLRLGVQRTLVGDHRPAPPRDEGLFGPTSASWQLMSDLAALPAGLAALLVQTQHPVVMSAVARNSSFRTDPLGRLARTVQFVGATTFGDTGTGGELAMGPAPA